MAHKQHIIFVRGMQVIVWVCAMLVWEFWGTVRGLQQISFLIALHTIF